MIRFLQKHLTVNEFFEFLKYSGSLACSLVAAHEAFPNGWMETNNYPRNCPGSSGSWRDHGLTPVVMSAALGDCGAVVCVGSRTPARGGIRWAFAVRQLRAQGT